MSAHIRVSRALLPQPSNGSIDFLDSSFFRANGPNVSLPSPVQVRALATDLKHPAPKPVVFPDLNLLVKFGPRVTVNEAQCLFTIKTLLGDKVPVPEVYGWRIDGRFTFIYMEHIRGKNLRQRWDSLKQDDKKSLCIQLREIMTHLRNIRQDPSDKFVGSVNSQSPTDVIFEGLPMVGSFPTVKAFNDWFAKLSQHWVPESQRYDDPHRDLLPDIGPITFTHGDLHPCNIVVSESSPLKVLSLVDWAHGGWYPDYWEYCKAAHTSHYDSEWRRCWIPKFLAERAGAHEGFAEFCHQLGS